MIDIQTSVSHQLGLNAASHRLKHMLSSLTERFPQQVHHVRLEISGDRLDVSFAAYGYVVRWEANVEDEQVVLHGRIPDAAKKFRGKIEQAIVARVSATLEGCNHQTEVAIPRQAENSCEVRAA